MLPSPLDATQHFRLIESSSFAVGRPSITRDPILCPHCHSGPSPVHITCGHCAASATDANSPFRASTRTMQIKPLSIWSHRHILFFNHTTGNFHGCAAREGGFYTSSLHFRPIPIYSSSSSSRTTPLFILKTIGIIGVLLPILHLESVLPMAFTFAASSESSE